MNDATLQDVVDAILDLSRITLAINGKFSTKAEAVRKLNELSIPPARIAAILAMPPKNVHARLSEAKQQTARTANKRVESESEDANGA